MLSSLGYLRIQSNEAVMVCGLGRLGQQCARALVGYRVPIHGVDLHTPTFGTEGFAQVTVGDFRDHEVLRRAGIEQCRSIMLLAGDMAANIEGAFAARRVNPDVRLVVRAEQQVWQTLLSQRLGNVVVYEPNRLSAPAFAFAVLDAHMLAHFYAGEQLFQITEHVVAAGERWVGSPIESVQVAGRQIVVHIPADRPKESNEAEFYGWHPEEKIHVGDRLLLLTRSYTLVADNGNGGEPTGWFEAVRGMWRDFHAARRRGLSRATMVALVSLAVILGLSLLAGVMFSITPPFFGWTKALRLGLMLIFGGHLADVTQDYEDMPGHMLFAELILTVMGTLLTAVLYALLTDSLLTSRFNLLSHRPRAPARGHVIIAGVGATGERIAGLLKQLRRPAVGIDNGDLAPYVAPHLPVIRAQPTLASSLEEAHLESAHGLAAVTADELQNVQIALLAASLNPRCRLAVRIFDPRLSENVSSVLPDARILCIAKLAATAYAAAALGEHVLSLFQMSGRPVLVVEFLVAAGDTLDKRALWEIAEGFAVVPVLFQPAGGKERAPSLDDAAQQLSAGDRLIMLASPAALEAIERGDLKPREYELTLERLRPYAEPLQVVGVLAQRLGYTLEQANTMLSELPQTVSMRLYGLYARRTCRLLQANGVECSLRRIVAQGPRGVVETLSPRPRREPAFDMRRNVNRAVQSRDS